MLWNRFHADREYLDLYAHPDFAPDTGIIERDEAMAAIARIRGSSHALIKARACAFVLEHCAVDVNPKCWFGANFAGRIPKYVEGPNRAVNQWRQKWTNEMIQAAPDVQKAMEYFTESGASVYSADYEHWVPDWDAVLRLGFSGLRERAREYRARKTALSQEQKDFFDSVEIMLTACIRFVGRLADLAEERIDRDERMPLRVRCLRHLEIGAPRDIYEALQLIYLFHLIGQFVECAQVRSLGDIDRLLYPYYLRDLYAGTFTREQVFELFQYFFLLYDFQNHHYNQPVSVGGTDFFGKTAFNELTDVILDAYFDAKLDNLKIHVFVSDNTPDAVLRKCMDMIRKGRGSFVFMNTKVGAASMSKAYQQPVAEWMLGSQGCYNFNLRGRPQHANQSRLNLPKAIELALFEGVDPLTGYKVGADTPAAEEMRSFDDFQRAFWRQIDHLIGRAVVISDFYDENMAEMNPAPLMSSTFAFSLEAGRSCFAYGPTSMLMMGLGTTADCLMMIKKHVFTLNTCTLPTLRDALRADWQGYEELRQLLYNDPDKYGNNLDEPDAFAVAVSQGMIDRVANRPNKRGSRYVCHFETIDRCFRSGRLTGATPDGRFARKPFSKNLDAAFGQDRCGLTAMMLSGAKLNLEMMPMGAPVDFMLHPSVTKGEEGLNAMVALLRAFIRMGGYALQGNVLDADVLRDAQKHPELYKNLQVRVSGWNWNFVDMEKEYQDLFIMQAEACQ